MNGKKLTLYPYVRKETNRAWKTIGQSLYSQFAAKFLSVIFNEMFTVFTENNLVSPNQSGFRPGDSFVNQLLDITHEIYESFDEGFLKYI